MVPHKSVLLDCAQAAEYLGIKERAARKMFDTRAVELVRLGRRLYVRRETLDELVLTNIVPAHGGQR